MTVYDAADDLTACGSCRSDGHVLCHGGGCTCQVPRCVAYCAADRARPRHSQRVYPCDWCERSFGSGERRVEHASQRVYPCDWCERSFGSGERRVEHASKVHRREVAQARRREVLEGVSL